MEIKIVHSADPALLAAITALIGALGGTTAAVKSAGKAKTTKATDPEPEAEEEEDLDGGEEEAAEEGVSLEAVREAAQKLIAAGKSAKLKAVLAEFDAKKVVDIKKADYAAALKKINAVK